MKKKFKILLAIAVISLAGWLFVKSTKVRNEKPVNFFQAIHISADKLESTLKEKYGLYPLARGHENPRIYMAGFSCYRKTDIESARKLMLKLAQEYISEGERNSELQQFLETPFSSDNLELSIHFFTPDKKSMPPEEICSIWLSHGIIDYIVHDPDRQISSGEYLLKTIHKESYEEALKQVK